MCKISMANISNIIFNSEDGNKVTITIIDKSNTRWQILFYKESSGFKILFQKQLSGASWNTVWYIS